MKKSKETEVQKMGRIISNLRNLDSKILKEENDINIDQTKDNVTLSAMDSKAYQEKFRQAVSGRVEFNPISIYPSKNNVNWSGKLTDLDVEWFYTLDDKQGVYITGSLVHLRDDSLELLNKLVGYYKNWSDEWSVKLSNEYAAKPTQTEP